MATPTQGQTENALTDLARMRRSDMIVKLIRRLELVIAFFPFATVDSNLSRLQRLLPSRSRIRLFTLLSDSRCFFLVTLFISIGQLLPLKW